MSDWRNIKDGREKYQAYLASREWALLRRQVMERCGGVCERCHANKADCVHHLTYARKYRERVQDLAGWCNQCHEFTHGKSDVDPAARAREEEQAERFLYLVFHMLRQGVTYEEICQALCALHERKLGDPHAQWLRATIGVGGLASDFAATSRSVRWRNGVLEVVFPSETAASFLKRPEVMSRIRECLSIGVTVEITHG